MLSGHPWNLLLLLTIDRQNPCQAQKPAVHPGPTHTHTHCTLTHTRNGQGRGLTTTVKRARKVNTDGNQSRKDRTHQSFGSSGSGYSEALHLAVPLQGSTLTSHSCTKSQSQDKWYCCLPSSLLERREEGGGRKEGGGREGNDPREVCSRKPPVLSPPPLQVQQGPQASRSHLEVPSIQEEKHVPNPRRVWLLWFHSGKVAVKTG